MSKNKKFIFQALTIIAWIIFVGLCIEAGALLVNFIFSVYNPAIVKNLYENLDLSDMYKTNKWTYYGMYSFILSIALLKAYLFYILTVLVTKLDLQKPFSSFVASKILQISYLTFFIGFFSHMGKQVAKYLMHFNYTVNVLDKFWADSGAFILMAAVVYIIAIIFSKGIELQNENDLTV